MVLRVRRDSRMASAAIRRSPAHQGEVAGLDRHVGAGAHGQAEVGLGQRGGVVDAVADHGHDPALGLEPLDHVHLVRGQHLGDHLVDADLGGHGPGGPLVVAGQQHRREAEVAQPAHRLGGGRLHRVGDDEDAARPAVPADRDRGPAGGLRPRRRPPRGRPAGAATSRRAAGDGRPARRAPRRRPGRPRPSTFAKSSTSGRSPASPGRPRRRPGRSGARTRPPGRRRGGAPPRPTRRRRRRRRPGSSGRSSPCRSCRARRCRPAGWTPAPRVP